MSDPYRHPKWQKKRLKILDRDGWKCIACRDSDSTLHVHHFYYAGNPWDTEDAFLQTLCESCHEKLGSHPKGGVWWDGSDSKDLAFVVVHWCPQCGCQRFKDKGRYVACLQCGWCTAGYARVSVTSSITLDQEVERKKAKPKVYSPQWLSVMMKKVRASGVGEVELFDILFPDSVCRDVFAELHKHVEIASETLKTQKLTVGEEASLLELLVSMRRAVQNKLGGITKREEVKS